MFIQIVIYWLLAQLFGLVGLPLTRLVLGGLPARGYAFSKALGLVLSGYIAWFLAMIGLAPFGAPLIIAAMLVVLLVGGLAHTEGRPAAILAWVRANWRAIVWYELAFTLALVYLAIQRSYAWGFVGPNPWGTERPMDFAFFNAIQRSASFPPHDPWLAGFSINYYYFGYLLMASVALLSGQAPGVAYNLSLALIFALTAQGVVGIVMALAALSGRAQAFIAQRARGAAVLAALSAGMILFVGNQAGALQILTGTNAVSSLNPSDLARAVANGIGPRQTVVLSQSYPNELLQGSSTISPTDRMKDFDWWWPSRALWDWVPGSDPPTQIYAITEFPFFSFWLGDMHPHVMALPFGLLAMAFALATLARPALPDYMRGRVGWLELIVTGVVLGALYLINSWDFPTYLLLFIGALLLRYARAAGIGAAIAWRRYAFQALMVAVAALVLFLPFHLTFRSLVGGKEPLINLPVLGTLSRTISLVGWPKTGLHTFLIIFGLFFLPSLIWVGSQALRGRTWDSPWLVSLVALVLATAIGFPLAALVPLAFYVLRAALRCARSQDVGAVGVSFALAAFGLACLIAVGTEVIFIRDIFGNRMNTIFKFYYQIWLILGVLAGYGLWALFAGVQAPVDAEAEDVSIQPYPLGLRAAALVLFVPLLAGALVYPAQTLSHLYSEGKASGLNGTNPRERDPNGAAAIAWLRQNARGDAVIVEAVDTNRDYGYDTAGLGISGVSSSTGLATVIGWTTHQTQWRGGDPATFAQIYPRWEDVRTIYTTLDVGQARTLLEKYGVRYIYVGGTERATYPPDALTKFDQIGTPVFQQGDVTIYQIGS